MSDFTETNAIGKKAQGSTAIVYVSLYFLLFAFFIFLHSISEPTEEKVREVIGSIDFAFKGLPQKPSESRDVLSGDKLGLAVFHAAIRSVVETEIPLVEAKENEEGDQLKITIPAIQLFADGRSVLRETRDRLFADTARILIRRSGVTPTDMEILIDTGAILPTADNAAKSLPASRLNALLSVFLENGVPARNMFIGMTEGGSGEILLKFYIRDNFDNQFRKEEAQ